MKLNPQQEKAVKHISSPLLVVSGAGTGKTTVITKNRISEKQLLSRTFKNPCNHLYK
jgi:DNA helicase-2/ATP-dependent DNA helicase PcrA